MKKYKNHTVKKIIMLCASIMILGLIFSAFDINLYVNTSAGSSKSILWDDTLFFYGPDGTYDYIVFGESHNASDGLDSYDAPKPPAGFAPYIYAFFDAGISPPWDKLFRDIRKYPDDFKEWDFYAIWNWSLNSGLIWVESYHVFVA